MSGRPLLLRQARLLSLTADAPADRPVDVRIRDGVITEIGRLESQGTDRVIAADGRWLLPGLWDAHVHLAQWAASIRRIPLADCDTMAGALERIRSHIDGHPGEAPVVATGFRAAAWGVPLRTDLLDAVAPDRPVVLISGDGHMGWLNSAALRIAGEDPGAHPSALTEDTWFAIAARLSSFESGDAEDGDDVGDAMRDAASRGIVGLVDMEMGAPWERWSARARVEHPDVKVRAAVYPSEFGAAIAMGLRTGAELAPGVTVGPLKVITDGSLGTLTAHCHEPYPPASTADGGRGVQNVPFPELVRLLTRARDSGFQVALHAIGDAAVDIALDALETTGAHGSIEHAQLLATTAAQRMATRGVTASVQPAHVLDDAEVIDRIWPDRARRAFAFREMLNAGVRIALGSDAPVSPLDPWLAVRAATREPGTTSWQPEQSISRREALMASTDGVDEVRVGASADLILVDFDVRVVDPPGGRAAATICAGRITHLGSDLLSG